MTPPNCKTKEFFVIKENLSVSNATKTIKQFLDAEKKKSNMNTIVMSLNYLKVKHNKSLLKLLQV